VISGRSAPLCKQVAAGSPNRRARRAALKLGRLRLLDRPTTTEPTRVPARLTPAERDGDNVVFSLVAGDQVVRLTLSQDDGWAHAKSLVEALESLASSTTETEDELSADQAALLAESMAALPSH
jgi:hypothetical protein